ncbi:MAG: response regulator, partial [Wenzhouxiangellaceae bacterium]
MRVALEILLTDAGYSASLAKGPDQAISVLRGESFDAVLCDMNFSRDTTSGAEGLALLEDLLEIDESLPVVAMTAWGSVDLAVQAMQSGAVDFIEKPWENNRLLTIVRTQVERARALAEADRASRVARL